MAALAESGYEKRPRRSSASSRNDRTVMIIVAQLHNPITLGFIDGIRRRLARAGMKTVITLSDYSSETECEMLAYAERSGFSGIFMLNAVECPRLISLLDSASAPVIFVNRYPRSRDSDVVAVDNYRSGYLATKYLIDRGHRAIAHIAGPRTSMTCRDRQRGFEDAMRTAGLPLDAGNIFYGDRSYKSGCECGEKIGKMPQNERFTAVFSATGVMAAGMIDRLARSRNTCSRGRFGDMQRRLQPRLYALPHRSDDLRAGPRGHGRDCSRAYARARRRAGYAAAPHSLSAGAH